MIFQDLGNMVFRGMPILNRVRKTKPESLFVLKYGVGLGRIKSRITRLKGAIEG